ncbi:MAG: TIGR00366 family protein [Bacteroidota bacterium]|nr:TIGR00366 family protein [Bacteroidota bacterium]
MSFSDRLEKVFKSVLPTPFTIAVLLTIFTLILAFFITKNTSSNPHYIEILSYWEKGLWNPPLLVFAMQMMLMLVLGHVLALTKPIHKIIEKMTRFCTNTANAAAIITFCTLIVSFFNWGLGLIFGAIFARKIGEHFSKNNIPINYPIIGACGYSGLMVWHGGISGSAPIKIAEEGHFLSDKIGVISQAETVFSNMNIVIGFTLIIILPMIMYIISKISKEKNISLKQGEENNQKLNISGAEKLDHSRILSFIFSSIILIYIFYSAFILPEKISLKIITPNFINLCLFGLGLLLHRNFYNYIKSIDNAIRGASGILIQFPLYFGIMGIMTHSGLIQIMSDFFVSISNENTFPLFTFLSAGIVNIFVPSGGGQWAVQGPIIVEAANQLGTSIPKSVMALAYGDQLTNMLQPFWALPLLGITGLKAKEILPYTLILLLVGAIIFITGLILF